MCKFLSLFFKRKSFVCLMRSNKITLSYNGPSSQIVDFQFRIRKFETFLCINFGIIVVTMDGRGTDANGDRFMKIVNRRLGEFETIDQLELAK